MENQSVFVGEAPRYTRNKRRQYQRQRRKAQPQISGLIKVEPEAGKVNNCQRKRPIKSHLYDSTSDEDMSIKRKPTDASRYKIQVKCENGFPNIEEQHGNKIKQPFSAWNNNRKPKKEDLPQPPQSWLYSSQSGGFRNPDFCDNQSWNSGGSHQNQPQWQTQARQEHVYSAQGRSARNPYMNRPQGPSNGGYIIEHQWNTTVIHHK